MANKVTVLGYGAIGRALVERLRGAGRTVVVAQRSLPKDLAAGVEFRACDALDAQSVRAACAGAECVVVAVGLPYESALWMRAWPVVMANSLEAASASNARLVFIDNLYMYGPQHGPLVETMPLTSFGKKPRVRAEISKLWLDAHAHGRVKAAAVRGADFFGPHALAISRLGDLGIKRLMQGKAAQTIDPIDMPHDFTFVTDFARAAESLIDAPDDAYGQAWHVPNASPTPTLRSLLTTAATQLGKPLALSPLPWFAQTLLSPFVPIFSEMREMRFQWREPYVVNADKFKQRFWSNPTSTEDAIAATIEAFRKAG